MMYSRRKKKKMVVEKVDKEMLNLALMKLKVILEEKKSKKIF